MSTNCPNCGGALAQYDPACPYCGTLVEGHVNVMLGNPVDVSYLAYGVEHTMRLLVTSVETEMIPGSDTVGIFDGNRRIFSSYASMMMKVRMEANVIPMKDESGKPVLVMIKDDRKIQAVAKREAEYGTRERDYWE